MSNIKNSYQNKTIKGHARPDKRIAVSIKNLQKRGIEGIYCPDKDSAREAILKIIPPDASIGFSGSVTLEQLGAIKQLKERGNKVFDPYEAGISRDKSLELRRQGSGADYYLASANAVSEAGELVFLSAWGNRTAGIAYAKNAIIVCGVNKIVPDLEKALKRAREYAAPLNYKRLNWPITKKMCCQVLIVEGEAVSGRLTVILTGENMGF